MAFGADIGDPIYQPTTLTFPQYAPSELPIRPSTDENVIAKIAGFAITDKCDAAIARLDVSSCCRCCGIDYKDEVLGLGEDGTPPSDKLQGLRRAEAGDRVFKVGIRTGKSSGTVIEPDYPSLTITKYGRSHTFTGQIEIEGDDTLIPFTLPGDSGAVIVDEDGFIVGLHFAAWDDNPAGHRSYSNHISDVMAALSITINLDRSASDTSGAPVTLPPTTLSDAELELYAAARSRLRSDPVGEWLWELAETHREEVVSLVTRHRPVTVVWHRVGGPALFAMGLKSIRAGIDSLPLPPSGDTLEQALSRVGDALHAHGSPGLRDAIEMHRDVLLAAVRDSVTVGDVLERLQAMVEA
jgi:hypothetical protein